MIRKGFLGKVTQPRDEESGLAKRTKEVAQLGQEPEELELG